MDLEFVRIEILLIVITSLLLTLPWGILHSVYLNRIGSKGMASAKRLAKKSMLVFSIVLLGVTLYRERKILQVLVGVGLGKTEAQFDLASGFYQGGSFLKQDFTRANYWYQRAAESDYEQAQYALALMYHYGEGTKADDQESLRWARRSAAHGNCFAMVLLGELLATSPNADDQTKASDSFRRAVPLLLQRASMLDVSACWALGSMYRAGKGVKANPVEGLKWMIIGDRIGLSPLQRLGFEQAKKQAPPAELAEANQRAGLVFPALGLGH